MHLLDEETETALLEKSRLYSSGRSFTFRLNNRNYQHFFLERNGAEWPDTMYYGGFYSRYFKAVIEEYCELPRFKREEVYFRDHIDTIQQAIDMTSVLRIRIESPFSAAETETWDVRPFDILPDPAHIYHYLVGRSVHAGGPRNEEKIASIRLSRIRDISILNKKTHRSGMLSATEKKEIRQKISLRSVSFLLGDEHEVIIRFTEDGKRMYQNTLFMRPHLQEVDEDGHYHFLCTQMQALQYFIRFGANAEILSPEEFRNSFKTIFRNAADMYAK